MHRALGGVGAAHTPLGSRTACTQPHHSTAHRIASHPTTTHHSTSPHTPRAHRMSRSPSTHICSSSVLCATCCLVVDDASLACGRFESARAGVLASGHGHGVHARAAAGDVDAPLGVGTAGGRGAAHARDGREAAQLRVGAADAPHRVHTAIALSACTAQQQRQQQQPQTAAEHSHTPARHWERRGGSSLWRHQ